MAEKATPKAPKKSQFLMYKGKPLVRSGNTLYYGKMCIRDRTTTASRR